MRCKLCEKIVRYPSKDSKPNQMCGNCRYHLSCIVAGEL